MELFEEKIHGYFLAELMIQPNQEVLENHDRSVTISFRKTAEENLLLFFILSNLHTHPSFNSRVIGLTTLLNNRSIDHLRVVFRHLNNTNQSPTCVSLKNHVQWDSDGCQLLSTNSTHSTCSCPHANVLALRMDFPKVWPSCIFGYDIRNFSFSQSCTRLMLIYYWPRKSAV